MNNIREYVLMVWCLITSMFLLLKPKMRWLIFIYLYALDQNLHRTLIQSKLVHMPIVYDSYMNGKTVKTFYFLQSMAQYANLIKYMEKISFFFRIDAISSFFNFNFDLCVHYNYTKMYLKRMCETFYIFFFVCVNSLVLILYVYVAERRC